MARFLRFFPTRTPALCLRITTRGNSDVRKRRNNSFPLPLKIGSHKTGRRCGERRCIAIAPRDPFPVVQQVNLPPSRRPIRALSGQLTLGIFSVELIRSMRASGRIARHAGAVSICEPTQTGSRGRSRDACTRIGAICARTHSRKCWPI